VSLSQGDVCLSCPGAVELGILLPHLAGVIVEEVAMAAGLLLRSRRREKPRRLPIRGAPGMRLRPAAIPRRVMHHRRATARSRTTASTVSGYGTRSGTSATGSRTRLTARSASGCNIGSARCTTSGSSAGVADARSSGVIHRPKRKRAGKPL